MVSFSSVLKPKSVLSSLSKDAEKSASVLPKKAIKLDAPPKPSEAAVLKPHEAEVSAISDPPVKSVATKSSISDAPGSSLAKKVGTFTAFGGAGLGLYQILPGLESLVGGGGFAGAAQTAAIAGAATVLGGDIVDGATTLGGEAIAATQSIFTDPTTVAMVVAGVVAFYVLTKQG